LKKKVINIITPHYAPEITAAAHRIQSFAKVISKVYSVNVITLTERGVKASEKHIIINDNLNVYYIDLPLYNKANFITRALYEFLYARKLAKKSKKLKPDHIIATSPFMFVIPAVSIYGGRSKKIIDIRDLVWCYLPDQSIAQRVVKKFFTWIAEYFAKKYNHVTVSNPTEKEYLKNLISAEKISILSNGIDAEKFEILSQIEQKPEDHFFNITYIGNIGTAQNMISLVLAAQSIPQIRVTMIGDGNQREELQNYIKEKQINNVYFTGKLSWNELLPYYQKSNALYAKLEANYSFAVPSKLYEYLSTGIPIIYSGAGEAASLLSRFEKTIVVDPSNNEKLIKAIEDTMKIPNSISLKNREFIKKEFIRDTINQQFLTILNEL